MATYLDYDGFKNLATIPAEFVDEVEKVAPGWVDQQLEHWSRWLDSRLRKRYATPFAAYDADPPTPPAIQVWLTRIVTNRVMLRRGVNPSDLQYEIIQQDAIDAKDEVQEAADSEEGLFDLPARVDENASAISQGNTRAYVENSPYSWMDEQQSKGSAEDVNGNGGSFV